MANKLRCLASSIQWFNCNHDCNKNISRARFLWKSSLGVKILIVHILSTLQHKKAVKTGKTGRLKKAFSTRHCLFPHA